MNDKKLPELLCPAGSPEALLAAIEGGADAVYLGGASFNARINAKNFTRESLAEGIAVAHLYGVKVYQTVNTMLYDRELDDMLRCAEASAEDGIDAFIVSDIGAAHLLHSRFPEIKLHASTQMSIHNSEGARMLEGLGFSRVVPARELSREDIASLVKNNPLEVEMFIHGALCVSHSGQCLFSSLVGGRSGNRGLCAQPCRLPYGACGKGGDSYPLSLKDLSLAEHIPAIIESGVASLKIEGRMKSPEYVLGVSRVFRRLLDGGRGATRSEMEELSEIFSRGGFTDGYYTGSVSSGMLGVRSADDKLATRSVEKFEKITRKIPVDMAVSLSEGKPSKLILSAKGKNVSVEGAAPEAAKNAPVDGELLKKQLSRLGDTPFCLSKLDFEIDGRLMLPVSALNALRREGVAALLSELEEKNHLKLGEAVKKCSERVPKRRNIARFYSPDAISERAREFFDVILLPLDAYAREGGADGFYMPPVILDGETEELEGVLSAAARRAPRFAVATNLSHLGMLSRLVPEADVIYDLRGNTANCTALATVEELGAESVILSAEMTLPQLRDIKGAKAAVVYGRIPLMTLEKCVIRELYGKRACEVCLRGEARICDRRGVAFPILREGSHRNVIYNSIPTSMSDRLSALEGAGIVDRHFIFTVESADEVDEVVRAFAAGTATGGAVRRIGS